MKQSEHKIQSEFIKAFRYLYPEFKNILFAIPNGGQRNVIVAAKLKQEGTLSGVPDLFFAKSNGIKNGLFIEFKAGKNKLTENQETIIKDLRKFGFKVIIAYSCNDALNEIEIYLNEKA